MDNKDKNSVDKFYTKFKTDLDLVENFPSNFTYKFIIPTSNKKLAEIQSVFDGANPQYQTKESKNGKYTSLTVTVYVLDSVQVIHYYKEVGKIEGVMML